MLATIPGAFGRLRRLSRAWRARLRHKRMAVALFMALTFGVSEPLMCIIHCQLWLPLAFQSYFTAQHQHHHHHAHAAPATAQAPVRPDGVAVQRAEGQAAQICSWHVQSGASSDVPFHVPPSPIHDMIPAMALVLIVLLMISIAPAAPPGDPPRIALPPPLRPPIPIAL